MDKRIGWSSTAVSISAGIVLAIYEVMGWTMPDLIAIILIVIVSLAGIVAGIVFVHAGWPWFKSHYIQRFGWRSPIYDKNKAKSPKVAL